VAIAPAGYVQHPGAMREIGVGYDGSPESEHALRTGQKLAAQLHTKLSALEAISFPARLYAAPPYPDEGTVEEVLDEARERIGEIDGVDPHVVYGQPAEELALYSASLDLLVIGSRSYGPFGRLVHGSTALQLAGTARCPLLVLTRGARKTAGQVPVGGREEATAGAAS
jgi:nucleotide-binding universal stress UspA family protein